MNLTSRRALPLVGLWLARTASAQVFTENAGAISPETPILRESFSWSESEHLREARWSQQLVWAPDPGHELKLTVPLVRREVEVGTADGDIQGLGDVSLRYKRSLWQRDDVMESTRLAFLAEVGAPTGEDDDMVDGVAVPPRLRISPGDWTLGAGAAFTRIRDRQRFAAELFYRHRTRHEGVRLGGSADLDLAYWYRLAPERFTPGEEEVETRGVIELLTSARFDSRAGGSSVDDGGVVTWLAPGIQVYPSKSVLLEAGLQLPVYQDVDDAQGDRRWAATLAVKFLF